MRTRTAVATTALAGILLTGCGSGTGDSPKTGMADKGGGSRANAPAAPMKIAVPPKYDGGKGWDQELDWVPQEADTDPVATDGTTVAYIIQTGSGYAVQARDGATGKVRWTSAPYLIPAADADESLADHMPELITVRQGGRAYFAAWAVGTQPGDALARSKEVAQINIYAIDASGSSVAPLHHVSVPIGDFPGNRVKARDSGNGLLIVSANSYTFSMAVDAVTGKVTRYDDRHPVPGCSDDCWEDSVVAVTSKGPVVTGMSGGLTVPGGWSSKDNAPKGLDRESNGTLTGVSHDLFVAYWRSGGASAAVWSAHDLQSGRLLASTECDNGIEYDRYLPVTSPNGDYIALGSVVLDVRTGDTVCLSGDENQRRVQVISLANSGTGYGVTKTDANTDTDVTPVVELNVHTNSPKALPEGTLPPVATLNGGAVFTMRDSGAGLRLSVRKER
ncbi:hypothetical protein AB0L85_27195 [Streptomyces sp. NPDC052051]|uniref:hypothetical protein n=1 Tax=Streptomyces sp. NPDC052051 TaxID=3154649 RepID=UPI00344248BC